MIKVYSKMNWLIKWIAIIGTYSWFAYITQWDVLYGIGIFLLLIRWGFYVQSPAWTGPPYTYTKEQLENGAGAKRLGIRPFGD